MAKQRKTKSSIAVRSSRTKRGREAQLHQPAPTIATADVQSFHAAAAALHESGALTAIESDHFVVRVVSEQLHLREGALLISNPASHALGFVLFQSYAEYLLCIEGEDGFDDASETGLFLSWQPTFLLKSADWDELEHHKISVNDEHGSPWLRRLQNGRLRKQRPQDLRLATAIARALTSLATQRPEVFRAYGQSEHVETFSDEDATLILTIPDPCHGPSRKDNDNDSDSDNEDAPAGPAHARAATLDDTTNPYHLSLTPEQLVALAHESTTTTVHQLVGAFCALASAPQPVPHATWLGQLVEQDPRLAALAAALTLLHDDITQRVNGGEIATLIPGADDETACAQWARGYATYFDRVDPRFRDSETIVMRGFEIHVLAGHADSLEVLDEMPEKDTLEESLAFYRERLVETASILRERWLVARNAPPIAAKPAPVLRGAVLRDDPCFCGSGKKYKRCCAKR